MRGPGVPGPPPPRAWADRDPDAWARLSAAKEVVLGLSKAHDVPAENLLQPDLLRRVCWTPPEPASADSIAQSLRDMGARPWQVELIAPGLADALGKVG